MLRRTVDAQQALADLTEISSQIQAAVVFDDKGKLAGSTLEDADRAGGFAKTAGDLLAAADEFKTGEAPLTQVEVATRDGSVFVVRDGKTCIAATTGSNPTVGLVFYDLKSALRSVKPAAKRAVRAKRGPAEGVPGNREIPATETQEPKTAAARKKTTTTRKRTTRKNTDAS
jgi:predicted regulator of Ras-like GTPase activity (Roadblock/LC7/MglB family)